MCQCPKRATGHFYEGRPRWQRPVLPSVNALSGRPVISTPHSMMNLFGRLMCQCPKRATGHFYRPNEDESVTTKRCVNALSGRPVISTEYKQAATYEYDKGVNALSGRPVISTLASQKPPAEPVPDTFWVNNCIQLSDFRENLGFFEATPL